jgi:hypothetical protein
MVFVLELNNMFKRNYVLRGQSRVNTGMFCQVPECSVATQKTISILVKFEIFTAMIIKSDVWLL